MPEVIDSLVINKGECDIPSWLDLFWKTVLSGAGKKASDKTQRLSNSYSFDSIYSVTMGNIKPRKHTLQGVGMKSMVAKKSSIF